MNQMKHVDAALSVLGKLNDGSSYTKPRRNLSAAAQKKMSLAQKARWANTSSTESADLSAVTEPEIEAIAKRHLIAGV